MRGSLAGHAPPQPSRDGSAFVEVNGVCMDYALEAGACLSALDRVSCTVPGSQFCSIVGPSGCGKSTLLMLTAGLYRPSAGEILINGRPVAGPRHDVGMVFQRDVLLEWRTVLDNVLLPIEVRRLPKAGYRDRALSLLRLVGLEGFEGAYPDQLSGGMRQRVAICRALVHDPSLLLMDEPFAAVDLLTREKLNLDLLRLTADPAKTVLFVTHSIEEAVLLSDQVLVMSQRPGRVLRRFDVDLPRPRSLESRSDARFHRLVGDIRRVFYSMGILS